MTHPSVNSIVERLEPCPFCGPGNSIVECYQDNYGYWKVGCGACGSHSGIRPKSDPDGRAKVVAHWNTRPAATIISELQAEVERDKLYWNGRCVDLQVNAHGWMKAHDQLLGFIQSKPELLKSLIDEKLAIKYPSPADVPEILQRALTAESSLSRIKAETIEECAKVALDGFGFIDMESITSYELVFVEAQKQIASAIRSLCSTGGGDAEEGSTQKEGSR